MKTDLLALTVFLFAVDMVSRQRYSMPVVLSFFLIGFFIWIAENILTFLGAWKYPNQYEIWRMVHIGKISSWFLLVIISIVIVVNLKHIKYKHRTSSLDYRQMKTS